jgi:D-beta-D-heptose 7-phosphate kinase / D-beta-D-heptose 1-phosphate adenosyltransferase
MKNLINKLKSAQTKKVLIIGDLMLDEYIFGDVTRISPEAPVPILKEGHREWSLGGAANVALNCKQIGCHINIVGIINNQDRSGKKICSLLYKNGISIKGIIKSKDRITTSKKRIMAHNQQLLRIDSENTNPLTENEFLSLKNKIEQLLTPHTIVLMSDYSKGILSEDVISYIIEKSKQLGCLVLLDPKGPNFGKYKNINYLKPNLKEFGQILDFFRLSPYDPINQNAKKICDLLNLDGIFITMGDKGIQFVSKKEDFFVPACKKEVFDITGAGDTVFAYLALGFAHKLPIEHCLKLANHAAAVAISHLKTYAVSLDDLIEKNNDSTDKIFSDWALLKVELDWLKAEDKKIVFTNGCFDLLHSGHIHLLNEAKKQGDILVAALNTDASIKRLKGPGRPIKDQVERAKVLAAIGVIDFITFFDQDTPKELIEYIIPDILVKGGDYSKDTIVGYDFVKANGGTIHIVDYQEGLATTKIIETIKQVNY